MINPITYLKEVKAELAKVTWPTPRKTAGMTLLVVGVSIFAATFVAVADFIFGQLITILI